MSITSRNVFFTGNFIKMRILCKVLLLTILTTCLSAQKAGKKKDCYSFSVNDIQGKLVSMEKYRGMVTLVVNVASECGYTDNHYRGLVEAQKTLGFSKFRVLAFPCNQFGSQEPHDNYSIFNFAKNNYKVNFPIFSKINVLDEDVPDAWRYLEEQADQKPTWNFWKYLVDADGLFLKAWGPWISVEDIFMEVKQVVDNVDMFERSQNRDEL